MNLIYPIKIDSAHNIGQPFGANWVDYSQFGLIGHNGQDFPASRGKPIFAVYDGWIVEQAAKDTGFGLRISQRIEADGKFYLAVYGHMLRLENPVDVPHNWFDKSRFVKQGQVIGYVDSTGYSTGDHVHLGLYEYEFNGNKLNSNNGYGGAINPMLFIGAQDSMKLVNDNGTVYIVSGIGNKTKIGIAQAEALNLFGDEPITAGTTAGIAETGILTKDAFVIRKP